MMMMNLGVEKSWEKKKAMNVRRITRGEAEMEAVLGNNDLLPQILVRLPAKSLIRFKRVSKSWFSFISNPQFRNHHAIHNFGQNHNSVFEFFLQYESRNRSEPIFYFSLHQNLITPALTNYSKSLHIIHSCNGLFLCGNIEDKHLVVHNFTTQKHRLLPRPPMGFFYNWEGIALAFDPSKSCGYKVVRFCPLHNPNATMITIFSSNSGSWKEQFIVGVVYDVCTDSRLVFWNGAIHWISDMNIHRQFQVDHEKFRSDIIMPEYWSGIAVTEYFGVVDHSLLLLIKSYDGDTKICSVLEMNKNSDCWALKYRVDFNHEIFEVMYVKSNASDEYSTFLLGFHGKIISYLVNKCGDNLSIARGEVLREYKSNTKIDFTYCSFNPVICSFAPV